MNFFKFLTAKYFFITGIFAFIAFIPNAITFGFIFGIFLLGIPGIILGYAPMLFLYSLVIKIFLGLFSTMTSNGLRCLFALLSTLALASLFPLAINYQTSKIVDTLRAEDKSIVSPVHLGDTIALMFPSSQDSLGRHTPPSCTSLCQNLLYNGAVKRVMVDDLSTINKESLSKNVRFYYISRQGFCPTGIDSNGFRPGQQGYNSTIVGNSTIQMRKVAGECLLEGSAPLSEAQMIFIEQEFKKLPYRDAILWSLSPDAIVSRRIELLQNAQGKLELLDRKTQIETSVLAVPLVIGTVGGYGFKVLLGFLRKSVNYNMHSDEYSRLFGSVAQTPVSAPLDLAGLFSDALNKKSPEADAGLQLFEPYLQSIITNKGGTTADVALISRAISDPRIIEFWSVERAIRVLGTQAEPIAKPIIDRIFNTALLKEGYWKNRETIRGLSYSFASLPEGAASKTAPELIRLARTPDVRGWGWRAVSRIRDAGAAVALPVYKEILNTPLSAYNKDANVQDSEVLLGALVGLCKMGKEAEGAKDDLIKYVHSEFRTFYPALAIETLGHFMSEEQLALKVNDAGINWKSYMHQQSCVY